MKCLVFKKLELTARKMLRWKVVRNRETPFDKEQQAVIARLQSTVKYYKRQKNRSVKKNRAGSTGNGGEKGSVKRPKNKCTKP